MWYGSNGTEIGAISQRLSINHDASAGWSQLSVFCARHGVHINDEVAEWLRLNTCGKGCPIGTWVHCRAYTEQVELVKTCG